MKRYLLVTSIIFFLFFQKASSQGNQTVNNGGQTSAINFTGSGCIYNWVNDTPGIGLPASGTGNIAPFTAINTGSIPLTATITGMSQSVGTAYITNSNDGTVSVIDIGTHQVIKTITVGRGPTHTTVSKDGKRVFVVNSSSGTISVINTTSNTVVSTLADPSLNGIVISPDGNTLYEANSQISSLLVVDIATNVIKATIPAGDGIASAVISPDGRLVYVTNVISDNVSVISTLTNSVVATIPVGVQPDGIAMSPDGSVLYVTNATSNTVSVINTATNMITATINTGRFPEGVLINADGTKAYVANYYDGTVSVINTATNLVIATIAVGMAPIGVSETYDGGLIYITNQDSNTVSVIDASSNTVINTIPVGGNPISAGSFIVGGNGCSSVPHKYTITVNPTGSNPPGGTGTLAAGFIYSCAGTASSSPHIQQFTVAGNFLTGSVTVTAPAGFEVSVIPNSGYGNSVTLFPYHGVLSNNTIYVRSAASAPVGVISGNVVVSSPGAANLNITVKGSISALPTVNQVNDQVVTAGGQTTAINFTGNTNIFKWTNDSPSIGLLASGMGDIASFTAQNTGPNIVMATITATPINPGFAYVTNQAAGTVSVVNTVTNTVVTNIPVGTYPIGVSLSPDNSRAYVVNNGSGSVSVINTASNTVAATITVGTFPISAIVSNDGSRVYVANQGSNSVSVIDGGTNQVTSTIPLTSSPYGIALSPDQTKVYVTNYSANTVSVINAGTGLVTATVAVGVFPVGIAISPDGKKIYVTNQNSNNISIIDAATNTVASTIPTGLAPTGITITADGSKLYVSNSNSNNISAISTNSNTVVATIFVGILPYGISVSADGSMVFVANQKSNSLSIVSTANNTVLTNVACQAGPYAFGNFVIQNLNCPGDPVVFHITVNPATPSGINTGVVTGAISACAGTASASPRVQQFTVTATSLTAGVVLKAPNNFEISLSAGSGFATSLTLSATGGSVNTTTIYVRSAVSAPPGIISGDVSLSSTGVQTIKVPVSGTVSALPAINSVDNQLLGTGQQTTPVNFNGTGNTFTWTNDTPGIGLAAGGTGNIPSFTAVNTGTVPVVATVTVTGAAVGFAYITNMQMGNVSVINTLNNTVTATIPVGANPIGVTISPKGDKVYVTNQGSNDVSVISVASNTVIGHIVVGAGPVGATVSPDGGTLYVTNSSDNTVSIINTLTYVTVAKVGVGNKPQGILVSADGTRLYVANTNSDDITIINTATNAVLAIVQVGSAPVGLAMSYDGSKLYVTNNHSRSVSVINTASQAVLYAINVGMYPFAIAITPDGSKIYVSNTVSGSVSVINALSHSVVATVPITAGSPGGVSVTPDGSTVYVTGQVSSNVTLINTATDTQSGTINVSISPVSFGNFITPGSSCSGPPVTFTITVEPAGTPVPTITPATATGTILACAGSPSASPQVELVTISGLNIVSGILVTAPANFEISNSPTGGFTNVINVPSSGAPIYVRSAASAPAGPISGDLVLTSAGAQTVRVPVSGTVNPLATVDAVANQSVPSGAPTTAINFTGTGNLFSWTNDTPGIGLGASGIGNIASFTATNTGTVPVTATVNVTPLNEGLAYVTATNSNTVSVVNLATNAVVSTIIVGQGPSGTAVSPDGKRVYVTNSVSNNVSVINTATNTVIHTFPTDGHPLGVVTSPDGTVIYVANSMSGSVTVFDAGTYQLLASFSGGVSPNYMAISADGKTLYVTDNLSNALVVINTATYATVATVPVGNQPIGIVLSPAGDKVYVINYINAISVINTATNRLISSIPMGTSGYGIAISADGTTLYVANQNAGTVSVIDAASGAITTTVPTGPLSPAGVTLSPDGQYLYVTCGTSPKMLVVSTSTNTIVNTIANAGASYSPGTFVRPGGCAGIPVSFAITVNPASPPATLITGQVTGAISACAGTPSVSPQVQQFTASGVNLTSPLTVTAPVNFEVSTSLSVGFSNIINVPAPGAIIYVRSAASAPAGNISGNVTITATGALAVTVPVSGSVNAIPTVSPISPLTYNNGDNTAAINFMGTGNSYSWVNDTPGIGLAANGSGNIASFTAVNAGSSPVTATVTVTPLNSGLAYIPSTIDGTVAVINTTTNTVEGKIAVRANPTAVTVSPDGKRVFVTNNGDNTISVIDVSSNTVIATFFNGTSPNCIAITPDGNTLYVSNYGSNTVSVIDANTYQVKTDVIVGIGAFGIVVSPDGSRVYVANQSANTVSVISTATNQVVETIGLSGTPRGIAVSPDGAKIYVTNSASNTVTVISAVTYNVTATITVGASPADVTLSPDGTKAYVTNSGSDNVSVINTTTGIVIATVVVGSSPEGISLSLDGSQAYVVNQNANTLSIINTATNIVTATVATGSSPIAFGNFIAPGTGCSGAPITFTITVNPRATPPAIVAGAATGTISACVGSASASPQIQQFTVSANNLSADVVATAPANFEISLAAGGVYTNLLTLTQSSGKVNSTVIYIRSAASAPVGNISGTVTLTSAGATSLAVQVSGVVNALLTVNAIQNVLKTNGQLVPAINFTGTGKTFTWTNDTPSIGLAASGTGDIGAFTAVNRGTAPVTATITVTPQPGAIAYVATSIPNTGTLTVINLADNSVVATIPVGYPPIGVSVSPDGTRVYVANQQTASISVINAVTNSLLTTIQFPLGTEPTGVVVSPDGTRVYASDYKMNTLIVIDATTNTLIKTVNVGQYPYGVAISPDGGRVYTANLNENTVSVINTATNTLMATVNTGLGPNGISVSPDGSKVYVTDVTASSVSVIDAVTNMVIKTIGVGTNPQDCLISTDGNTLYVTNTTDGTVSVINTATYAEIATIPVGTYPSGLSETSDGSKMYVTNLLSQNISIINTSTNGVIGSIPVGKSAYCFGNFISGGGGCPGVPITFTITVDAAAAPAITATSTLVPLTTPYGAASPSESFSVAGSNLTAGILVTAPTDFEVSTDNVNFSSTVTVGAAGNTGTQQVYVRLMDGIAVGNNYSGDIKLSSAGVPDVNIPIPPSTVTPVPLSIIADDKSKVFGEANPVLTASYIGFVNNDTPVQLTVSPVLSTTTTITSAPGQYPISVDGAESPNYIINYLPGILTVEAAPQSIVIPNTFTPNGDGINDTWNIKFLDTYQRCLVNVYNRYGQMVYMSTGYGNPWDGTYKGAALPAGTYYYVINLENGDKPLSGYVAIIR